MVVFLVVQQYRHGMESFGVFSTRERAQAHVKRLPAEEGRVYEILEETVKGEIERNGVVYLGHYVVPGGFVYLEGIYGSYEAAERSGREPVREEVDPRFRKIASQNFSPFKTFFPA